MPDPGSARAAATAAEGSAAPAVTGRAGDDDVASTVVDPGPPIPLGARRSGRRPYPDTVTITFPRPGTLLARAATHVVDALTPPPSPQWATVPCPPVRRPGLLGALLGENGLPRAATVAVSILAVLALTLAGDDQGVTPGSGTTAAEQSLASPGPLGPGGPVDPADLNAPAAGDRLDPDGDEASSNVPLSAAANAAPLTDVAVTGPTSGPSGAGGAGGAAPEPARTTLPAAAPAAPLPATPTVGETAAPATLSSSGVPERARAAYTAAAERMATLDPACKLSWPLIAAIARVESDHGRAHGSALDPGTGRARPPVYGVRLDGTRPGTAVVRDTDHGALDGDPAYDRAVGPLQFLPATWNAYALDGDDDGTKDPQDVDDAALTAGRYLCAGAPSGGDLSTPSGQWSAAYRYNRSTGYANLVLALATTYATGRPATVVNPPNGASTAVPTITVTVTPVLPAVTLTTTLGPGAAAPVAATSAAPASTVRSSTAPTAPSATSTAVTSTVPPTTTATVTATATVTTTVTPTGTTSTATPPGDPAGGSGDPAPDGDVVTVVVTATTVTVVPATG